MQAIDNEEVSDKHAFGKWICAKLKRVPEERWDDFEEEAIALVVKYTKRKTPVQLQEQQRLRSAWPQPSLPPVYQQQPSDRSRTHQMGTWPASYNVSNFIEKYDSSRQFIYESKQKKCFFFSWVFFLV